MQKTFNERAMEKYTARQHLLLDKTSEHLLVMSMHETAPSPIRKIERYHRIQQFLLDETQPSMTEVPIDDTHLYVMEMDETAPVPTDFDKMDNGFVVVPDK